MKFILVKRNVNGIICFRLAKKGVNVNQRHTYGWTALQVAAINGHTEYVQKFLFKLHINFVLSKFLCY